MRKNQQNLDLDLIPDNALPLFTIVKDLDIKFGYERSFKLLDSTVLSNRHLLSLGNLGPKYDHTDKIIDICKQLKMPEDLLKLAVPALYNANMVHFGFEEDARGCIYKVYFEYQETYKKHLKILRESKQTLLGCVALKWDPGGNARQIKTRYTFYPSQNPQQIIERISDIYNNSLKKTPAQYIQNMLKQAPESIDPDDIIYLEVNEENNTRKSFDINLYNAGILIKDLYPSLVGLTQHYRTPLDQFLSLYNGIKNSQFGHISGGIDREGRDFSTIYYGVEGYDLN